MVDGVKQYELLNGAEIKFQTPQDQSFWFGYYNYCPMNRSGEKILAHKTTFDGRDVNRQDTAEIGWFSLDDQVWHPIGRSAAVNWQQGSMTQWYYEDDHEYIIYNDVEENHFVSRIREVNGELVRTVPYPIYGLNSKAGFSVSVDFERSYWCRAYHYESIVNNERNRPVVDGDGVFRIDLRTGEKKLIIPIEQIIEAGYIGEFKAAKHWIEHIMLNPSGTRFAFYHRFDAGSGYRTRVLTANVDGTGLYLLPDWELNDWSHLGWKDDTHFVIFGIKRKPIGEAYQSVVRSTGFVGKLIKMMYRATLAKLVTPQIHHKIAASSCYQLYKDREGRIGQYDAGLMVNDGHPSFTKDGRCMLTDTYADAEGYRHLMVYDIEKNKLTEIGKFYSPYNACGYRADLHPRFSPDESQIIIDSAHSGRHQMIVMTIGGN